METIIPLIVLLGVSFLVGIHASSRVRGRTRNFFVGGNIMPIWVVAISLSGQAIDVGATAGSAAKVLELDGGFWAGVSIPIGLGCSLFLIGLFYAKPLHRLKLLTLADYFYTRYDKRVELLASLACVVSSCFLVAANLAGVGTLLHLLTGIDVGMAMTGIAALVLVYTIAGGLFAACWNDIFHVGLALLGLICPLVWLLFSSDALQSTAIAPAAEVWQQISADRSMGLSTMASLVALALGDVVALDFMERVFAAKTPAHAQRSCAIAGILVIVVGTCVAVVGVFAALSPGRPDLETFVRDMISHAGVRMSFYLALVAACISTLDGALMAASTVMSRNICQRNFPRIFRPEHSLFQARIMMVVVAAFSLSVAMFMHDPGELLVMAFDVVLASCFVPLTLGIYWRGSTTTGALVSIITASTCRIVLELVMPQDWVGLSTLASPLVSLVVFVAVSKWSSAAPPQLSRMPSAGAANEPRGERDQGFVAKNEHLVANSSPRKVG
jgi:Na+/proline symporter